MTGRSRELELSMHGFNVSKDVVLRDTEGFSIMYSLSRKSETSISKLRKKKTYPDEDLFDVKTLDSVRHPILQIPRKYLFGRQTYHEFESAKKFLAEKAFLEDIDFLNRAPIILTLINDRPGASRLVIIDGHHRVIESSNLLQRDKKTGETKLYYENVPSRVFSAEEMADLMNRSGNKFFGKKYTTETLTHELQADSEEARHMNLHGTHIIQASIVLEGISGVEQLTELFTGAEKI